MRISILGGVPLSCRGGCLFFKEGVYFKAVVALSCRGGCLYIYIIFEPNGGGGIL